MGRQCEGQVDGTDCCFSNAGGKAQPKLGRPRCGLCDPDLLRAALATQGGRAQLRQRLRNMPGASRAAALVLLPAERHVDFQEFDMAILDPHWQEQAGVDALDSAISFKDCRTLEDASEELMRQERHIFSKVLDIVTLYC